MAFTYVVKRVGTLAVGDQVAGWVADGKNSRVFPEPTVTGTSYPSVVKSISVGSYPSGTVTTDMLYTVYLGDSNYNNLPVQFTVNGHSDWIITTSANNQTA